MCQEAQVLSKRPGFDLIFLLDDVQIEARRRKEEEGGGRRRREASGTASCDDTPLIPLLFILPKTDR